MEVKLDLEEIKNEMSFSRKLINAGLTFSRNGEERTISVMLKGDKDLWALQKITKVEAK